MRLTSAHLGNLESSMELNSYEVHVPTEQYGFILGKLTGSADAAVEMYREIKRNWDNTGLSDKELDAFLDAQLSGDGIKDGVELYERMSPDQKAWAQRIKRSIKRKANK